MVSSQDHVVRVLPSGIEVLVAPGVSILKAAQEQGVIWPTLCKGDTRCARCYFEIVEGEEELTPMSERERNTMARVRGDGEPIPGERLACSTSIKGDVVVFRHGVVLESAVNKE
jgi:uncharacterized 2Fe-2S/4Fe-4S cluster protein (DUF4445 family)